MTLGSPSFAEEPDTKEHEERVLSGAAATAGNPAPR